MRKLLVSAVLMLFVCGCAFAAEAPPIDIPIYPGGEATLEINMTNEDLLPALKAMLPLFASKYADQIETIDPADMEAIIKDLDRVQVLQIDITGKETTVSDIAKYYNERVPGPGWNRVFWQSSGPVGTIALYTRGSGENMSIYGFRVREKMIDEKPVKQAMVAKTEGFVDVAKLVVVAAKLFMGG